VSADRLSSAPRRLVLPSRFVILSPRAAERLTFAGPEVFPFPPFVAQ